MDQWPLPIWAVPGAVLRILMQFLPVAVQMSTSLELFLCKRETVAGYAVCKQTSKDFFLASLQGR